MINHSEFFPIERNRYFYGKLLTVRDFEVEQRYQCSKRQLINRIVVGAGVVCGFGVTASDENTLVVESGVAVDYRGREVVLEEPLFRKLQMLDGYGTLLGREATYLCLTYDETDIEPVNAVGAETERSRQFNLTQEACHLYLTVDPPEYRGLMEAKGLENVEVFYSGEDLTLVLSAPAAVCGGEEFTVKVLVVKNAKTPPVRFRLEGESAFVESENGKICLEFYESPEERRNVYTIEFRLNARSTSGMASPLFPTGGELNLELGSHHYKNYIEVAAQTYLCRDRAALQERLHGMDNLERHLRGRDIPIYLAKLELINSDGGVFLGSVTNLPFEQSVADERGNQSGGGNALQVTTSVRGLEYWQKPDVKAVYKPASGALHFDFGIPSPEQYDYAVSHGTVDLTMPGGIRVNSRVYSEEIAHGLGAGMVDIRLSVEFPGAQGESTLLYGNSEVFKSKNTPATPPWVEAAAVLYPERGTMRVGLWVHDTVDGNRVTVHFFAQKPERDTSRLLRERKTSLSVTPEFSRLESRDKLQFKAEVVGSEDKTVLWSVKDESGGSIDRNGIYQAPELPGTYEILAVASADEMVRVSAFVIVE